MHSFLTTESICYICVHFINASGPGQVCWQALVNAVMNLWVS